MKTGQPIDKILGDRAEVIGHGTLMEAAKKAFPSVKMTVIGASTPGTEMRAGMPLGIAVGATAEAIAKKDSKLLNTASVAAPGTAFKVVETLPPSGPHVSSRKAPSGPKSR